MIIHDHFDINEKGHLTIGGLDALELAKEFGTPAYIIDENAVRSRCREYMETVSMLVGLGKAYGAETAVSAPHPGWKYVRGGSLQTAYDQACRTVLGKPAEYQNIHAGLECGAIITAMNQIDGKENAQAISIGPNLHDIHSVKEAVEISSCERFYAIISQILKNIK